MRMPFFKGLMDIKVLPEREERVKVLVVVDKSACPCAKKELAIPCGRIGKELLSRSRSTPCK